MRSLALLPLLLPASIALAGPQSETLTGPLWSPPTKAGASPNLGAPQSFEQRVQKNRELESRRLRGAGSEASLGDPSAQLHPGSDLRHSLYLDSPGSGRLSAFGGSYKAEFDGQGSSYIPFFGSTAPRNFPLTFGAPQVALGDMALEIAPSPLPRFEGSAAVLQRGACEERYELAAGRMEQLYIFESLPAVGGLVLEIPVQTELVAHEVDGALEFRGEWGSVRYSHAIALDADGRQVAAPTSWTGKGVRIEVPAAFLATAKLPVTIDPVLSTFDVSTTDEHTILPDIAFEATNGVYLVTYERVFSGSDHDIFAEFHTIFGSVVAGSGAFIDSTSDDWRWASVASNKVEGQFLVAAENRSGPTIEVWGRTRESESLAMSTPFQISANTGAERYPDVGGDPNSLFTSWYMVVYERESVVGVDHDILGRRVSPTAGPQDGAVSIANKSAYDKFPSISKSNGLGLPSNRQWNVTWQREWSSTDWDIYGSTIDWTAQVATTTFPVSTTSRDEQLPSSSSSLQLNGEAPKWMAAYQSQDALGEWNIRGTVVQLGELPIYANLSELFKPGESEDQFAPSIDSDGFTFTLAWPETVGGSTSNQNVFVGSVYLAGTLMYASEQAVGLGTTPGLELQAQVCSRRSGGSLLAGLGVVWRRGAAGQGDIQGAIYDSPGGYGEFIGTNYCGPAVPHTGGTGGKIRASGSRIAGGEPLSLLAYDLPINQVGYFVASPNQGFSSPASSSGNLCLSGPISRFNALVFSSGSGGAFELYVDTTAIPSSSGPPLVITAGESWNFQAWFRDGQTNNFTDGVNLVFQ